MQKDYAGVPGVEHFKEECVFQGVMTAGGDFVLLDCKVRFKAAAPANPARAPASAPATVDSAGAHATVV